MYMWKGLLWLWWVRRQSHVISSYIFWRQGVQECVLRPNVLVMIDSTKKATHLWEINRFLICRIPSTFLHHSNKPVGFSQYPSQSVSWMTHLHLSKLTVKPLGSTQWSVLLRSNMWCSQLKEKVPILLI